MEVFYFWFSQSLIYLYILSISKVMKVIACKNLSNIPFDPFHSFVELFTQLQTLGLLNIIYYIHGHIQVFGMTFLFYSCYIMLLTSDCSVLLMGSLLDFRLMTWNF
jgi:hypothetical protein